MKLRMRVRPKDTASHVNALVRVEQLVAVVSIV